MGFSVKHTYDVRVLKEIKRNLKKLSKTEVEWGWINNKKYPTTDHSGRGGIYIAAIAATNEYGGYAKNFANMSWHYVPARPYFQQAIQISREANAYEAWAVVNRVLMNTPYRPMLDYIGSMNVDFLKTSVDMQNMAPLHPKTVALKGNDYQWKDTGTMLKNITYKVVYKRSDYKGDQNG